MTLLVALANISAPAFVLLLFAIQLAVREVGVWIGRQRHALGKSEIDSVSVLVGSMLALLAFVLALTLSYANGRFQDRRAETLREAGAISSAWTRAQVIGTPRSLEIARLLETYTRVRKAFVEAPLDAARLEEITRQSDRLQVEMLGHLTALVREHADPVNMSLMNSLDNTFDATARTRFAFSSKMSPQLFWLLIGMSVTCMGALGYQIGLRGQALRWMSLLLTAMWTMVIADILDLSSARIGRMRNETGPYEWVLASFADGLPIPPLPQKP